MGNKNEENSLKTRIVERGRHFLASPWAGGVVLIVFVVLAMLLANLSATKEIYHKILSTELSLSIGDVFNFGIDIEKFINDGLMVVFFFSVGLEIKHEILEGQLSSFRQAILPVVAALGGMIAPALIFTAFNFGGDYASGWGIPTATDIAFAIAIMSLLGDKVPVSLKVFLTALAIADDLGAIVVIALFYGGTINWLCIGLIAAIVLMLYIFRRKGVYKVVYYIVPAIVMWYLFYNSGVHATIAGMVMAMMIPSKPHLSKKKFLYKENYNIEEFKFHDREGIEVSSNEDQHHALLMIRRAANDAISMSQRMEHLLNPYVTFLIMPVFALANAGVEIQNISELNIFASTFGWGIFFGLMLGKPLGIFLASWITVKTKLGVMPQGASWKMLFAVACLGGIGFTMSIFIDTLAFSDSSLIVDEGKIAVLLGSCAAAIFGFILISIVSRYEKGDFERENKIIGQKSK